MCSRPFETRSLPNSLAATHRGFAFYVTFPKAPFDLLVCPSMSLASPRVQFARGFLAALPSMSLVPFVPFLMLTSYFPELRVYRATAEFFDRRLATSGEHQ